MNVDKAVEITIKRERILLEIGEEPCRRAELNARVDASRSTIYRAVDSLQEVGLIKTDMANEYTLTQTGNYLLDSIRRIRNECQKLDSAPQMFSQAERICPEGYQNLLKFDLHSEQGAAQSAVTKLLSKSDECKNIQAKFPGASTHVLMDLVSTQEAGVDISITLPRGWVKQVPTKVSGLLEQSEVNVEYETPETQFGWIDIVDGDEIILTLHRQSGDLQSVCIGTSSKIVYKLFDGGKNIQRGVL